jgi:hypothetical protein
LHNPLHILVQPKINNINPTLAMQLVSVLCAFQLLHCYASAAHPTIYPKTLEKRGVEGAAVDTQLHHLHKRMEGSSSAERMSNFYSS